MSTNSTAFDDFTTEELSFLVDNMDKLPRHEQVELQTVIETLTARNARKAAQLHFLDFMSAVEPSMLQGPQHKIIASAFDRIRNGTLKRVIINIAPRHSKSTMSSYLFPAFFLGNFPNKQIIMASHTADLAVDFGRKVRNLVASPAYTEVFPGVALAADSKAAGRWNTNSGGLYYALGVGGAMAGRGGDLVIIDDPHSEQEAKSGNPAIFDAAYEWYQSGPRQRLQPGGAIVVLMCMVGGTDVLRADGSTTKLRDIRPGDEVATFENGEITTSRVNNWMSSGVDSIYTIQTQSGIILQANERHPFLVDFDGVKKWTRLRDLKPGMLLVASKAATDPQEAKQNPDSATLAKQALATTRKIQTPRIEALGTTVSGKECCAHAENQQRAKGCALDAIEESSRQQNLRQKKQEQAASNTGTESQLNSSMKCCSHKAGDVLSVENCQPKQIHAHTGTESCASTTATIQTKSEGCCATTVTSQLATVKLQKNSNEPLSTYVVFLDEIVSIVESGSEEVFDVEIDRTENFIANGVVSHNTRWNKRDLTGRLIENMVRSPDGDEWEVIELPAILPSGLPLWPDFWPLEELNAIKATIDTRYWQAQYMQNPVSDEGALIKREWWRLWEEDQPPACEFILGSLDAAAEVNNRADYTSITIWGVFYRPDEATGERVANIILLESIRERMEFPELKECAYRVYKDWELDAFIVEKKSAGTQLYQEMRAAGVPVSEFTPTRATGDKFARLNAVADIVRSGLVWYPAGKRWAEELVDEIAGFPSYGSDDRVDTTSMALARFRSGGFIRLPSDRWDDDNEKTYHRPRKYY